MADKIKYVPTPTEQLKAQIYDNLMLYFKNIAVNMFEWEGFPENISSDLISSDIIENWFYEAGRSVFFDSDKYGYLCLKVETQGQNVVGKPTKFVANGYGYVKELNPDECVLLKNNATSTPTRQLIEYYVEQIADIELVKKLRRNAHKTPMQIETSDETELTAKNIWKKWDAGEPVLYKNKSRSGQSIGVNAVNTDVDYINDKLNDEENTYIADTPGFSTFDISEIESKDLANYFKEFKSNIKDCEFVGCTHIKEQDCGVKRAVEEGRISQERYERFCKIYEELKDREKHRW